MSQTTLRHIFLGLFLLLLFHFETISIGGVKISHLWKGLALLYISFYLIKNNKIYLFIYGSYILIAIIQLLHIDLSNGFSTPIFKFIITLFFPLTGIFLLKYNVNPDIKIGAKDTERNAKDIWNINHSNEDFLTL